MRTRKAVITAAGRGTRQFPATRSLQKELLPLVDTDGITKPTLQIIVEECVRCGIEEVCVVVEKNGRGPFEAHFAALSAGEEAALSSKPWAMVQAQTLATLARRITYVEQNSPEGFGHAVYQAKDFAQNEPILLLLGDHVYTTPDGIAPCVGQMLQAGEKENGSVTALRLEPEADVTVTGIAKCAPRNPDLPAGSPGQTYDILALKEKPTVEEARENFQTPGLPPGFYLCHFGIHLFTPEIFDCLHELIQTNTRVKNEFQLTSAQALLLQKSLNGDAPPYRAAMVNGTRWDTGVPDGYLETLFALAQRGPYAAKLSHDFGLAPVQNGGEKA